nr:hypothetical protein [Tanacetum cinerariifolium]
MGKTSKVAKRIQGGQSWGARSAAVPTRAAAHAREVLANAENEKSPSMTGFLFMSSAQSCGCQTTGAVFPCGITSRAYVRPGLEPSPHSSLCPVALTNVDVDNADVTFSQPSRLCPLPLSPPPIVKPAPCTCRRVHGRQSWTAFASDSVRSAANSGWTGSSEARAGAVFRQQADAVCLSGLVSNPADRKTLRGDCPGACAPDISLRTQEPPGRRRA